MRELAMPGLGEDSVHHSYDEIARELRRAAARLAAPLAAAARNRRMNAEHALRLERDELARLGA